MNTGVLKVLGHNLFKVNLDSYGAIVDKLMFRKANELIEKLSIKRKQKTDTDFDMSLNAHHALIFKIINSSDN